MEWVQRVKTKFEGVATPMTRLTTRLNPPLVSSHINNKLKHRILVKNRKVWVQLLDWKSVELFLSLIHDKFCFYIFWKNFCNIIYGTHIKFKVSFRRILCHQFNIKGSPSQNNDSFVLQCWSFVVDRCNNPLIEISQKVSQILLPNSATIHYILCKAAGVAWNACRSVP